MVPTDSLFRLIDASLQADYSGVRRIANELANSINATEPAEAKRLKSLIRKRGVPLRSSGYSETLPSDPKSRLPLVEEVPWPVTPAFLDEMSKNVFSTFISDAVNIEKLVKHGLAGRLNMLLYGPPGTGKTLVAGHVAAQLRKPLYVVRLESVISSLLGDTAKNLRSIFEFVPAKGGVLLLDEVDAVAKLRDDKHEVGELKRVVNTLIQGLDSLDDASVVLAATNHPNLLDPAIWRRFPYKIECNLPNIEVRNVLWKHFLFNDSDQSTIIPGLAKISDGLSGADIESISLAARRRSVLNDEEIFVTGIVKSILESHTGRTVLPYASNIDGSEKKRLSMKLHLEKKLSKAEVARLLGVSRQSVSGYLRGENGKH